MSEDDLPPYPTFTAYRPLALAAIVGAIIWAVCYYFWPSSTIYVAAAIAGILTSIALGSELQDRVQRRKDELDPRSKP